MEPKYKRVLLKLSGEALAGDGHVGIDYDNTVLSICRSIKECVDLGVESVEATSGGAVPAAAWIAPGPTIWVCWQPLSMHWPSAMRWSHWVWMYGCRPPLI